MNQQLYDRVRITHIGGPTALIEIGQFRILTDPTFDPAGTTYEKTAKFVDPALSPSEIGTVDLALVSHDHHADNLDLAGQAYLSQARHVLTTRSGAQRLGNGAQGVDTWETVELMGPDQFHVRITATPAHHGPEEVLSLMGDVNGWIVQWNGSQEALYISGDTVLFDGLQEVGLRYHVGVALLHFGAAQVKPADSVNLTLTGDEGAQLAQMLGDAVIVPIHYEGWAHYSQGRAEIEQAFTAVGIEKRLRFIPLGEPVLFDMANEAITR